MKVVSAAPVQFRAAMGAAPAKAIASPLAGPDRDVTSFSGGCGTQPKFGVNIRGWRPFGDNGYDINDFRRTLALLALLFSGYLGLDSYKDIRYPESGHITTQQVDESAAGLLGSGAGTVLAVKQLLKKDKKKS